MTIETMNWVVLCKLTDDPETDAAVKNIWNHADHWRGDKAKEQFSLQSVEDYARIEAYRRINTVNDSMVGAMARNAVQNVNWKWVADRLLDRAVRGWKLTVN